MEVMQAHGARIPVIGFGTMTLKEDLCVEMVEAALHLGYRHLDTAQMYGNEREVGSGLRGAGLKREDVFLTTKVWFTRLAPGDFERSVEPKFRGNLLEQFADRPGANSGQHCFAIVCGVEDVGQECVSFYGQNSPH